MDDEEATEGADRVAGLFVRALLGGLVALWGFVDAREQYGATERAIDAANAVRSSLRATAEGR